MVQTIIYAYNQTVRHKCKPMFDITKTLLSLLNVSNGFVDIYTYLKLRANKEREI